MNKNLLIIESPNKIKTISKYLSDKDFDIVATVGHIRDIPKSNAQAFDKKTFEPKWLVTKKPVNKQLVIDEIKQKAAIADKIYLASDPDREGEAIAWHVYDVLDKKDQNKCVRVTFNEISKEAIEESFNNERKIDIDWVYSQFARRIIDRIIGYSLSKFVKNKYHGISAGRVQSVVLKFIYEREKEIEKFVSTNWWTIDITLENKEPIILREINPELKNINFININDDSLGTGVDFKDEKSATLFKESLSKEYIVYAIDQPKAIRKNSKEPYKTSTMQQDAINRLHWDLNKVTNNAQDLYEGIEIDGTSIALISYPRTDSIRMADSFISKVKKYIEKRYGNEYFKNSIFTNSKKGNIQDAHECIRIIDPYITPESIKSKVSSDHYKLYDLIWKRTIASLMSQAIYESTIIRLSNNNNKFYSYSTKQIFDGFRIVYPDHDDKLHSIDVHKEYVIDQKIKAKSVNVTKHTTLPPPRYNQASLIKVLDESEVGRPSTYRMMANIGLSRGYCILKQKAYYMLKTGNVVIEGLIQNFSNVIDKEFTKEMEARLDKIADREEKWNEWLIEFSKKFESKVTSAFKKVAKIPDRLVGRKCPLCDKELVIRYSPKVRKEFIGCSAYPHCKYAEFPKPIQLDELCPECGHNLVVRNNRRNMKFVGCSNYPNCKFVKKYENPTIEEKKS